MKNPSFTFPPCKPKKDIGSMLSLLIWLKKTAERKTTFAKAYGMKVRCYWEHVGNKRKMKPEFFLNNLPSRVLRKAVTCQHWFLP
jgi:hypothetical protein